MENNKATFPLEIEERKADEIIISGYVNAVGRDSIPLPSPRGTFVEQVTPGTFAKAISTGKPIELRFNHDRVIGSTSTNLKLVEDNIGLKATATITDPEVIKKAKAGKLRGWSFRFSMLEQNWEDTAANFPRRHLNAIDLKEVSILDKLPAYPGTSVELRDGEQSECRTQETEPLSPTENPNINAIKALKAHIEIIKIKGEMNNG